MSDSRSTPALLPPPDVSRARRGRYLSRHNARVIEQDDLLVIEFVDQAPWYTRAVAEAAQERRTNGTFVLTLMGIGVTSSAMTLLRLFHWI